MYNPNQISFLTFVSNNSTEIEIDEQNILVIVLLLPPGQIKSTITKSPP
ncbi:3034_t:CDS:1, partial [Acaulospora morrowiae]